MTEGVAGILLGVQAEVRQRKAQVLEEERPHEQPLAIKEAKEWVGTVADGGADELKGKVRALTTTNFGDNQGGAKVERAGLRGREKQDCVVLVPGDRGDLELRWC
ncbi:hypothetical protein NDA18_003306 [Ustilago nuda]|nr:hypothetical protein NDA18_003306 [Ustilago nuda]